MLIYCEALKGKVPESVPPSIDTVAITESAPFWKVRPELYAQVKSQQAIFVSAKETTQPDLWLFMGGGHIKADLDKSWRVSRKYELLSRLSWFIEEVKFDEKSKELSLNIKFMGFQKQLVVIISESKDPRRGELNFKIVKGFFEGLTGKMILEAYSPTVTEASVNAIYSGEVPFNKWIFARGAEVVMHYVSSELRKLIESPEFEVKPAQ